MSTNVTSSGLLPAANVATSVRSSSLLPAPVVPAIRACGPSPTRSTSTIPSAVMPIAGAGVAVARRLDVGPAADAPSRGDGDRVVDRGEAAAGEQSRQRHRRGARSDRLVGILRVVDPGDPASGIIGHGDGHAGGVDPVRTSSQT